MVVRKSFVGAVIALAACAASSPPPGTTGGGSNNNNNSGGGGMTATEYITQIETAFCGEAFTCMSSFPTSAGVTFADAFGASQSDCVSLALDYDMPAAVESEISAGKIHYDASAAAACVAGITFGACTDFWTSGPSMPSACDTAIVGIIADGGACVVDFDCSSLSSYCNAGTCGPDQTGSAARTRPRTFAPQQLPGR